MEVVREPGEPVTIIKGSYYNELYHISLIVLCLDEVKFNRNIKKNQIIIVL